MLPRGGDRKARWAEKTIITVLTMPKGLCVCVCVGETGVQDSPQAGPQSRLGLRTVTKYQPFGFTTCQVLTTILRSRYCLPRFKSAETEVKVIQEVSD